MTAVVRATPPPTQAQWLLAEELLELALLHGHTTAALAAIAARLTSHATPNGAQQ